MATFYDNKQALQGIFQYSYNYQSITKQHHCHRRKLSQNCYTI